MLLVYALLIIGLAVAAFVLGRRVAQRRFGGRRGHSMPGYHGAYVLLWAATPALILLILASAFDGRIERMVLAANAPEVVEALEPARRGAFVADASRVADGLAPRQVWTGPLGEALNQQAASAHRVGVQLAWGGTIAALLAAVIGGLLAIRQIRPELRARNRVEGWIGIALFACSAVAILTTIGIVASLLYESARFFQTVPIHEFLFGTQWSPQIAIRADQIGSTGAFGAAPLFVGTFLIMVIAMVVAAPIGLMSAIYLSEYAGPKARATIKPLLEILAGVPTVVYGFFAAMTVGPALRETFNGLGAMLAGGPLDALGQHLMLVQNQMALVAGAVMGIMLIPFVSSLSDDIINAVPQSLRDGSYAMGATKSETVQRVLLPAALPGVAGAMLLAVSRAIGETMIVTMAAGLAANLTLNPLDTVTTVTVQIVTLLTGDQEFDSPKTLAAFGLGLTLFVVTLMLNIAAQAIVRKYREQYD
jgi:phosphate transport system permease protein